MKGKKFQLPLAQKVTSWLPQVVTHPASRSLVRGSPRPAQSCNSHFQPAAKIRPVGGEYRIIPSRLLWETRFSDQETRCLKQTKNTLRSEWKSMRDNVWKVINSEICGGEREKWRPFHPTERQWVRGREKVEKQPTILMTNRVSSRAGRVGRNVTQRTLSKLGRGAALRASKRKTT